MPLWLLELDKKWIAIGVLSISTVTCYELYRHKSHEFDLYQTKVEAVAEAQAKYADKVNKAQDKVTKDTQNGYKTNTASVGTYYARLRQPSSSALPVIPNAPARADGSTDYTILVGQCAETTLQLTELQKWVSRQQDAE